MTSILRRSIRLIAAASILTLALVAPSSAQSRIEITANLAALVSLAEPAGTIIIGNPEIADATVADETTLILTGRSVGMTNLIVLDTESRRLADILIRVTVDGPDHIIVQKGGTRQTFLCDPACEPIQLAPGTLQRAPPLPAVAAAAPPPAEIPLVASPEEETEDEVEDELEPEEQS